MMNEKYFNNLIAEHRGVAHGIEQCMEIMGQNENIADAVHIISNTVGGHIEQLRVTEPGTVHNARLLGIVSGFKAVLDTFNGGAAGAK